MQHIRTSPLQAARLLIRFHTPRHLCGPGESNRCTIGSTRYHPGCEHPSCFSPSPGISLFYTLCFLCYLWPLILPFHLRCYSPIMFLTYICASFYNSPLLATTLILQHVPHAVVLSATVLDLSTPLLVLALSSSHTKVRRYDK